MGLQKLVQLGKVCDEMYSKVKEQNQQQTDKEEDKRRNRYCTVEQRMHCVYVSAPFCHFHFKFLNVELENKSGQIDLCTYI